jgi:predicted ArsR family transcriptional regulator
VTDHAPVIRQALGDVTLPATARLMMWHLSLRLCLSEYREVYTESIANEMRIKANTASVTLDTLVSRGYLDESGKKKPRAFRLPFSRRQSLARAA